MLHPEKNVGTDTAKRFQTLVRAFGERVDEGADDADMQDASAGVGSAAGEEGEDEGGVVDDGGVGEGERRVVSRRVLQQLSVGAALRSPDAAAWGGEGIRARVKESPYEPAFCFVKRRQRIHTDPDADTRTVCGKPNHSIAHELKKLRVGRPRRER